MLKIFALILVALLAAFPALAEENVSGFAYIDDIARFGEYSRFLGEYSYPFTVAEGWLYYSDASKYALVSAMEDVKSVCAIKRVNIATGEVQELTGEGATLLDVNDAGIVYALNDFYITENGDTKAVSVGRGVYKADLDGKNAVKLCDILNFEDGYFERYGAVSNGVVYAVSYSIETDEPIPPMVLKRVTLDGAALSDIPVDFGELIGASGKNAYIFTTKFDENSGKVSDEIISVDTNTGEKQVLTGDRQFAISDYLGVDANGHFRLYDERIYFIAAEKGDDCVRLWSVKTDGSDIQSHVVLFGL